MHATEPRLGHVCIASPRRWTCAGCGFTARPEGLICWWLDAAARTAHRPGAAREARAGWRER